jgi:hypothetical protein
MSRPPCASKVYQRLTELRLEDARNLEDRREAGHRGQRREPVQHVQDAGEVLLDVLRERQDRQHVQVAIEDQGVRPVRGPIGWRRAACAAHGAIEVPEELDPRHALEDGARPLVGRVHADAAEEGLRFVEAVTGPLDVVEHAPRQWRRRGRSEEAQDDVSPGQQVKRQLRADAALDGKTRCGIPGQQHSAILRRGTNSSAREYTPAVRASRLQLLRCFSSRAGRNLRRRFTPPRMPFGLLAMNWV